jgi:hypothetical protein
MLTYKRIDNLEVFGYSDADFVGCADSQRFTSGYVFTLVSGAISWRSCKQTITISSTMYAELIACYEVMGYRTRGCPDLSISRWVGGLDTDDPKFPGDAKNSSLHHGSDGYQLVYP